jgi:galactokinase
MGVGLSSSAALEVATLRALRRLLDAPIDDVEIAQMAQRAEIDYAGVRCGIMDQMASSLADTEHALFLDARSLETRPVVAAGGNGGARHRLRACRARWCRASSTSGARMRGSVRAARRRQPARRAPRRRGRSAARSVAAPRPPRRQRERARPARGRRRRRRPGSAG